MARSPQLELERLYRRYHREITRALTRELGDRHEAEDVTQEAFLNAFRALERGNRPSQPRRWLHAIALNANRRRHRKRRPVEIPFDRVPEQAAPEPAVGRGELVAALRSLPPDQRAAYLLREVGGYSYGDVAERLGRSEGSVQMLLFRARQSLRSTVGAFGGGVATTWQRLAQWLGGAEASLAGSGSRAVAGLAATVVAVGAAGSATDPAVSRPDGGPARPAGAPSPVVSRAGADRDRPERLRNSGAVVRAPSARSVESLRAARPAAAAAREPGGAVEAVGTGLPTVPGAPETPALPLPTSPPAVEAPAVTAPEPALPQPALPQPTVPQPTVPQPTVPQLPPPVTLPQVPDPPPLPEPPPLPTTPPLPEPPTVTVPVLPG